MFANLILSNIPLATLLLPVGVIWLVLIEMRSAFRTRRSLQDRNVEDHWPFRHRGDERY